VKDKTNVFVHALAESKALYNGDHTQVTVAIALAAADGNTPSTSVDFTIEKDVINASINFSGATWKASTTGTFVYECHPWG